MNQCVLVLSYGKLSAMELVENILNEMKQPKLITSITYESVDIKYFKCDIRTKYYTTSIYLIPFDEKLDRVPAELNITIEALIVYFEPFDRTFINSLSTINNFLISNKIELGFLVTTTLSDRPNELTFEELRESANVVFDIITLKDEDGEEHSEELDKYSEIVEGLENFVWSNIKTKPSSSTNGKQSNSAEQLENELNDFEKLLITAQNLRSDTRLTRDEILNKAEELAEVMSAILNDNDSD